MMLDVQCHVAPKPARILAREATAAVIYAHTRHLRISLQAELVRLQTSSQQRPTARVALARARAAPNKALDSNHSAWGMARLLLLLAATGHGLRGPAQIRPATKPAAAPWAGLARAAAAAAAAAALAP